MKFIINIIIISFLFTYVKCDTSIYQPENCTEIYSTTDTREVPYTEWYLTRNFFGLLRNKSRISYKTVPVTTQHERKVCCNGYKKSDIHMGTCEPVCKDTCGPNSFCSKPDICSCVLGFEFDGITCEPVCENECVNGFCENPNQCQCNEGYDYIHSQDICDPLCHSCPATEYCVEPNVCDCISGYTRNKSINSSMQSKPNLNGNNDGPCQPICDKECINSVCVKPNICQCYPGYEPYEYDLFICMARCIPGCENGYCESPDTCVCLEGYAQKNKPHVCEPVCSLPCFNAECTAPDTCTCLDGYEPTDETNRCEPRCSNPCTNGQCSKPETCSCNIGYELRDTDHLCEPICSEPCFLGNCTSPETCTCLDNYKLKEGSKFICEPICSNECINGQCTAPEKCLCDIGYEKNNLTNENFKCIPVCECEHGYCSETSSFCVTCAEGYDLVHTTNSTICKPHCEGDCVHGHCIRPQVCQCDEHYISRNDSQGNPICIHACGMECIHGICLEDIGNCSCTDGWSGKYCDEPLFCSITISENDPFYLQLNESTFDILDNATFIEQSLPTCHSQCLNKIDNSTKCFIEFTEDSSNFVCSIELDSNCTFYLNFQQAGLNITVVIISTIFALLILIIAIYGTMFVRKTRRLSVELTESLRHVPRYPPGTYLYDDETSNKSL